VARGILSIYDSSPSEAGARYGPRITKWLFVDEANTGNVSGQRVSKGSFVTNSSNMCDAKFVRGSFCVRPHLHRIKFFLMKSHELGSMLTLLKPNKAAAVTSVIVASK
jgi:hypothetical protein